MTSGGGSALNIPATTGTDKNQFLKQRATKLQPNTNTNLNELQPPSFFDKRNSRGSFAEMHSPSLKP